MKQPYQSPTSLMVQLEISSMLAASPNSFEVSASHDTEEQYSSEKQFDNSFEESGEWEW